MEINEEYENDAWSDGNEASSDDDVKDVEARLNEKDIKNLGDLCKKV